MLRGRSSPLGLVALVVSTAIAPQDVWGAATCRLRWPPESTSRHAAKGQPRRDEYREKPEEIRS
jgi:hypothetical protein